MYLNINRKAESKSNPYDQQLKQKYNKNKNQVISDLPNAEIQHYSNEIYVNISDTTKTWNVI